MQKKYLVIILAIFVMLVQRVNATPVVISQDTVITDDIIEGIKVVCDCTITFKNQNDITIGSCENTCSGIEIENGKTLVINIACGANVNVYSGYYIEDDNEYDCAGIYVPNDATLIIDSKGAGKLIVYPFDRGAGIGGNGVFIEKSAKDISCMDAGKIVINKGKVVIQNAIEASNCGMGAKIGGGGICNTSDDVQVLFGGTLGKFEIKGGQLNIMAYYGEKPKGVGAIIGGGGIANFNNVISSIQGGDAIEVNICKGKINVMNNDLENQKGVGSVIGGGGIYNEAIVDSISKGQLFLQQSVHNVKIKTLNDACIYGDGGIYSNGIYVNSGGQSEGTKTSVKSIGSYLIDKVLDMCVIFSGLFMIMELIT